ncbi:hypothetical protein HAX54_039464 [Datura stramonium]|uniref:Uncharacterized protein n=1 Tax=Datura stramonium TaxID=4076 RepID=A0ABS8VP78_DATST|nr:hypothetical protein [Datura stramonium]
MLLETITKGNVKRSIFEEVEIRFSNLTELPNVKKLFDYYWLGWLSESSGEYSPAMIGYDIRQGVPFLSTINKKVEATHIRNISNVCDEANSIAKGILQSSTFGGPLFMDVQELNPDVSKSIAATLAPMLEVIQVGASTSRELESDEQTKDHDPEVESQTLIGASGSSATIIVVPLIEGTNTRVVLEALTLRLYSGA